MPTYYKPPSNWVEVILMHFEGQPVSGCGSLQKLRLTSRLVSCRPLPTLMLRFICHRQRGATRPFRTQKLSSCTPTILGGRLPGKIGNANTNLHSNVEVFLFVEHPLQICYNLFNKPEYVQQTETAAPCVGGCTISAN